MELIIPLVPPKKHRCLTGLVRRNTMQKCNTHTHITPLKSTAKTGGAGTKEAMSMKYPYCSGWLTGWSSSRSTSRRYRSMMQTRLAARDACWSVGFTNRASCEKGNRQSCVRCQLVICSHTWPSQTGKPVQLYAATPGLHRLANQCSYMRPHLAFRLANQCSYMRPHLTFRLANQCSYMRPHLAFRLANQCSYMRPHLAFRLANQCSYMRPHLTFRLANQCSYMRPHLAFRLANQCSYMRPHLAFRLANQCSYMRPHLTFRLANQCSYMQPHLAFTDWQTNAVTCCHTWPLQTGKPVAICSYIWPSYCGKPMQSPVEQNTASASPVFITSSESAEHPMVNRKQQVWQWVRKICGEPTTPPPPPPPTLIHTHPYIHVGLLAVTVSWMPGVVPWHDQRGDLGPGSKVYRC